MTSCFARRRRLRPGQEVNIPTRAFGAAAAVAVEWLERVLPQLNSRSGSLRPPTLLDVDANNLRHGLFGPGLDPEIVVSVRAADGEPVALAYGRRPTAKLPRIATATKAEILRAILLAHPGLTGVRSADLRFRRHWRKYLGER